MSGSIRTKCATKVKFKTKRNRINKNNNLRTQNTHQYSLDKPKTKTRDTKHNTGKIEQDLREIGKIGEI